MMCHYRDEDKESGLCRAVFQLEAIPSNAQLLKPEDAAHAVGQAAGYLGHVGAENLIQGLARQGMVIVQACEAGR